MRANSARKSRLRLDSLEDRVVPTVTTSFDAVTGRLIILGEANDSISVSAIGPLGAKLVAVRQANVAGTGFGPRLNGSYFLNTAKVKTDSSADILAGGPDIDWLFVRSGEDQTDDDPSDLSTAL
jgi:hypothetical protein